MKTNKWWVVLNPYPEGGKPTVRHSSFGAAHKEAARIAELTGKKCHVLELVGTMHPPGKCTWVARNGIEESTESFW